MFHNKTKNSSHSHCIIFVDVRTGCVSTRSSTVTTTMTAGMDQTRVVTVCIPHALRRSSPAETLNAFLRNTSKCFNNYLSHRNLYIQLSADIKKYNYNNQTQFFSHEMLKARTKKPGFDLYNCTFFLYLWKIGYDIFFWVK